MAHGLGWDGAQGRYPAREVAHPETAQPGPACGVGWAGSEVHDGMDGLDRLPEAAGQGRNGFHGSTLRPPRARPSSAATLLLRRMAGDRETIDLSVSSPGGLRHLPPADPGAAWAALDGHGLDPSGLPQLRAEVASHLSEHQQLPTEPGQLVITAGAQEALWLLSRALRPHTGPLVASCPTYPGLAGAVAGTRRPIAAVPANAAGTDPGAIERAGRSPGAVAYLMPTGRR